LKQQPEKLTAERVGDSHLKNISQHLHRTVVNESQEFEKGFLIILKNSMTVVTDK